MLLTKLIGSLKLCPATTSTLAGKFRLHVAKIHGRCASDFGSIIHGESTIGCLDVIDVVELNGKALVVR